MTVQIAISFDTTGSIFPALTSVRRNVEQTLRNLFTTIPDLSIALIAHGDYDDRPYAITHIDFTTDVEALARFVRTVDTTNGFGNGGEQYERVLRFAREDLHWDADNKAFVLIGDERFHRARSSVYGGYGRASVYVEDDALKNVRSLVENGITPYMVRCLNHSDSRQDWNNLAKVAQTPLLHLAQFADVEKLLIALTRKTHSDDSLRAYTTELRDEGLLNRNLASLIDMLLNEQVASVDFTTPVHLEAVDPSRFQVLYVDSTQDIQSFVNATGATFRKGRGFYQLTKRELIQEQKEVVLVNPQGDMFSGAYARELIGLPYGERGNVQPYAGNDYMVFVQSTSSNRKLIGGTKFLYDTH